MVCAKFRYNQEKVPSDLCIAPLTVKLESRNAEVTATISASETLTKSSSPACSNRISDPQVGFISKPPKSVSNPKIQKSSQLSSKRPSFYVRDTIRKAPPNSGTERLENSYGDDILVDSLMRRVWGKAPANETSPWRREFVAEHHPYAKQNYDKVIRALRIAFKEVHLPVVAQAWKADFRSNKEAEEREPEFSDSAERVEVSYNVAGDLNFEVEEDFYQSRSATENKSVKSEPDVDDHFTPMVSAEFPPCTRSPLPIPAENMKIDIEGSDTEELEINIDHRLHSPSKSGESCSPTAFADCKESPDSEQSGYSANTDITSKITRGKRSIEELYDRMIEISAASSKRIKLPSI
ncbi:hypothetical protein R1flu_025639 [Riccia fluitans]|uniref:Uncharacterized protein n=1 Tax=Riccia fluitans TaxID=41844 RepID=A0ABD1XYI8_9MARC